MISLKNVTKKFGNAAAVNSLSLEVKSGEIFAFLGPNGAGKTTTIKMIVGLLNPTEGEITVGGFNISNHYLEAKRIMSYIPDEPFLYDKLSGMEFLHFIADMYNVDGVAKNVIEKYIDIFSMKDYINELTESYSHGMKQRLVLSATLLRKPKILIVDEPLVGLDPQSTKLVRDLFREEANAGTTIFMSTHLISIAEEISDRVGIINNGKLIALGTMDELKSIYKLQSNRLEDIFFTILGDKRHNK
ncbi:MAG: hypothetical protein A2W17_02585 [Planctomycetes bacterium RBG_16_41_13]|nr:MAG: hypothetical protein A2W17_02585 [Planctomycetes bacterium RBG_16_41_13]